MGQSRHLRAVLDAGNGGRHEQGRGDAGAVPCCLPSWLLACARRTFGSKARWTWPALLVVVAGTSVASFQWRCAVPAKRRRSEAIRSTAVVADSCTGSTGLAHRR